MFFKMWLIFSLLIFLQLILNSTSKETKSRRQSQLKPITCVIGGGISGLSVGTLLKEKGHKIFLFETKPFVGGKMLTLRPGPAVQIDVPPIFYGEWDTSLIKRIEEFDLTSVNFNENDGIGFDPTTGSFLPWPQLTEEQRNQLMETMNVYLNHRVQFSDALDNFGYLDLPGDLCVSIGQWLDDRSLGGLKEIFMKLITLKGYGALDDTPALFALKHVGRSLLTSRLTTRGTFKTLDEGLDIFAIKMASKLDHIFLSHHVVRVVRSRDGTYTNVTSFNEAGQFLATAQCQKVIFAFPPLLPNLERMISDLSLEEREVLDQVKINKFVSGTHHIPSLKRSIYTNSEEGHQGTGQVLTLVRHNAGNVKNVYTSYSWIRGDFRGIVTREEDAKVERQLTSTLTKLNKDYLIKGPSSTFFRATSEFFPHVNTKSLKQGFFKELDKIQGQGGLYYATTLLGFETIDGALKMTEGFVDKYF